MEFKKYVNGAPSQIPYYQYNRHTDEHVTFPATFDADGRPALSYQVYGKTETVGGADTGVGVQTENSVLEYLDSASIGADGLIKYNAGYDLGLAEVENGKIYSVRPQWSSGNVAYGFFMQKPQLGSISYDSSRVIHNGTASFSFTAPITGWVAMWSSNTSAAKHKLTIVPGSTAPASYIPPGYKIPLTNTSGETENLFDWSTVTLGQRIQWTSGKDYADVTAVRSDYIYVEYNKTYKCSTFVNIVGYDAQKNYLGVYDLSANAFLKQAPRQGGMQTFTNISSDCKYIKLLSFGETYSLGELSMFVEGSVIPDHYIPYRYTADYNLYIGSTKLGTEEYVDYQEQKIYRTILLTTHDNKGFITSDNKRFCVRRSSNA